MTSKNAWRSVAALAAFAALTTATRADERKFTYVTEPDVLPKGAVEFEQWITSELGRDGGDYANWLFREDLEYGFTDRLTAALYLNFQDEFFSPDDEEGEAEEKENGLDFKGVSIEAKYQLVNPYKNPVGVLAYFEATTDGAHEFELEEKLVLGSYGDVWSAALNLVLEQEWEVEHGETEEESVFEVAAGLSRRLNANWTAGLEAVHERVYVDGVDFAEEEFSAIFIGPNIHYAVEKWWVTLTVLPQVYGDGDGSDGDLQLVHSEQVHTRLIAGINF
jgi:hypothetical protein